MAPSATNGSNGTSQSTLDFTTFKNSYSGKLFDSEKHAHGINPATLEALPDVPIATKEDLTEAIKGARAAFKTWSKLPRAERNDYLVRFGEAMDEYSTQFAELLTKEQGKPTFQALMEPKGCLPFARQMRDLPFEEEVVLEDEERKVIQRYVPMGVVGGIIPWNFPIAIAHAKIISALTVGNVVIIKPSPFTPYCNLKMGELAQKIFPPGVVSFLSGDDHLGPWITAADGIDKISFTGSIATGKLVAASAAMSLKRVTLELGGNDPAIILPDVDIATVAPQMATFAFMNSGQICVAVKRIYIHKSIYNEFREVMVAATKNLSVGNGATAGTFCGPLQNKMQYDKVQNLFADISKQSQKIAVGGEHPDKSGYFIQPTIIDNPAEDSRIVREEPFGPIVPIMMWEDEEDVIERANNTDMGLGASVWGKDVARAEAIGRRLESGTVWINQHFHISPQFTFGGFKHSGLGVEFGKPGLIAQCNIQTVNIKK